MIATGIDTGVDISHQVLIIETRVDAIVTAVSVPNAASFTNLTVKPWSFPTSQTITAAIVQSAPAVGSLRLRVRGYDPRGAYQEETSPVLGIVAKTNNIVYMSALWSKVTEVAYIASGMSVGATIAVGQYNDLKREDTATFEHIAPENLGWWVWGQNSSRKNPGVHIANEICDPHDPAVRYVNGFNKTTSVGLSFLEGAETIGVSAIGWFQTDDKIGIDWTKVESAFGGAPTYVATNSIQLHIATVSKIE